MDTLKKLINTLVPTNKSKEKMKKYEELWIKIRNLIRSITKSSDDYDEKYMSIKFNSDAKLSLVKMIKLPTVAIVVRNVFLENNKYYPHHFLENVCIKYKNGK